MLSQLKGQKPPQMEIGWVSPEVLVAPGDVVQAAGAEVLVEVVAVVEDAVLLEEDGQDMARTLNRAVDLTKIMLEIETLVWIPKMLELKWMTTLEIA